MGAEESSQPADFCGSENPLGAKCPTEKVFRHTLWCLRCPSFENGSGKSRLAREVRFPRYNFILGDLAQDLRRLAKGLYQNDSQHQHPGGR
jgi:hypothetical protein